MTPRTPSRSPEPAPEAAPEAAQDTETRRFYERAIDEASRDDFAEALALDGLDEEVAILRLHLRRLLTDSPEDARVLQAGVRLLISALLAQRRLTDREAEGIGEAVAAVVEQFSDVMRGALDA